MRLALGAHGPATHMTYCTNVHPGERWDDTFDKLRRYLPAVKQRVSPHAPFGVGLRLSALAARELRHGPGLLDAFRQWLADAGLYVFTLNGFPYGPFHGMPVKDRVYAPDWSTPERSDYTLDLVQVLGELLPPGVQGSISTVPLSYKPWFAARDGLEAPRRESAERLAALAWHLGRLEEAGGKRIRIGLEPEPDGLVETSAEACAWLQDHLLPAMHALGARHGLRAETAEALARRHVGLCLDTCHASVQFESPAESLDRIAAAGIAITKLQVSAALKVAWWRGPDAHEVLAQLRELNDPVYLHQVRELRGDGQVGGFADLGPALARAMDSSSQPGREWRIHFHVPLFTEGYGALASTHDETAQTLRLCVQRGLCDHLEIETYTWDVLPDALRTELVDSITREFDWTRAQLQPHLPTPEGPCTNANALPS